MKNILYILLLLLFTGFPIQTFAAEGEQTTTVRTTIHATKAPELEDLITKEKEKQREKDDYTEDSWNKYQAALKEAEDVLKNFAYDEEKVSSALVKLQQAIKGLVLKKSGDVSATPSNRAAGSTTSAKSYPKSGMASSVGLAVLGVFLAAGAVVLWDKRKS